MLTEDKAVHQNTLNMRAQSRKVIKSYKNFDIDLFYKITSSIIGKFSVLDN